MQNKAENVKKCLSDLFDKEARIDDSGVKVNIKELNGNDMFILNRISVNSNLPVQVKRSGTGLVIIFNC